MTIKAQSATAQGSSAGGYLILQGLASPFFKELAAHLARDGSSVHKVNYCGGDWWFSGNARNHRFNGKADSIEAFYRSLIDELHIKTIILFGDCRPIHAAARRVAKELGLKIWVFEEGYIRPGFITCEKGGTNDLTNLPRKPEKLLSRAIYLNHQGNTQAPDNLGNPMPRRVRMDFTHHLWNILLKPFYFRYRTHRPDSMAAELSGWAARFKRKAKFKSINAALIKRYENPDKPFFLVPLQLNSDFQIREHSDYAGVLDFIRETVASFAKKAPKKALLVLKSHPLDNGMIDYRNYIALAALQNGVDGRVDYIEGGDLDTLLDQCEGVVLINSTVGFAALKKAKPMKVMGRALYDMEGLAEQRPLDKFWKNPIAPDASLIGAFLSVVHADSQTPGDFFTDAGIKMAAKGAFLRIKADALESGSATTAAPEEAQPEEVSA